MDIELVNHTPFLVDTYEYLDREGMEYALVLVRGRYKMEATLESEHDWNLVLDEDQGEWFDADIHYDDDPSASIRFEKDRVDFKLTTDVIANAIAHAPEGRPVKTWQAGVKVGEYQAISQVYGPRQWVRDTIEAPWKLTEPEAVTKVPLRYELAYGGEFESYDMEYNELSLCLNPCGCGLIDSNSTARRVPAHQIENTEDVFNKPNERHYPQGLGFINRYWEPRKQLTGVSLEQIVDDSIPPLQAENLLGNQAANVQLIMPHYLVGDEVLTLINLLPGKSEQTVSLPREIVYFHSLNLRDEFDRGYMALDTLVMDLIDRPRFYISWRAVIPTASAIKAVKIAKTKQVLARGVEHA
ncbi:MAG: hypothetical protein CSB47_11610 [Proteobacteria bacterium]|nr:MAG: hypothetical protein CSB47_11610 [Pseudomonadota bacterium]